MRNIAQVTTAVAGGDLSQKITVDARGEILELKSTVNTMVDQLSSFADEVTRVAREVGIEGKLGGQAEVEGVAGTWRDLTENVNELASNLTGQVRNIAQVTTAVASGDLSQKITVDARGEILELKSTVNTMVDQLSSFADEVTRVAREVGIEGKLGGQAEVEGVAGTWRDLTENVNELASNLTGQVRNIAQVTTAVASGDLSQKITVDARGEILQLKSTVNTMVDQLSSFADEVTRVAREVGTEGKLGGQAQVRGVSGTWRDLTENVNQLASTLTTQLRAISAVSTSVARGDLTQQIQVAAFGEVAELKHNINQMIVALRETTQENAQQGWLDSNLARIGGLLQGQRNLAAVGQMIMNEVAPLVDAQIGAFFLAADPVGRPPEAEPRWVMSAGYAISPGEPPLSFGTGEGLVGQAAANRQIVRVADVPADYLPIRSGSGATAPRALVVLPVQFEDECLGVIELGSVRPFSALHLTFLERLVAAIGVAITTIRANRRTEELLAQSQGLATELQDQSAELQRANAELEEKAEQLSEQNRNVEIKNMEIDTARRGVEEKAQQLAVASQYKSEFLANMSHELRTPLNSLLLLSRLLADNPGLNLTDKQIEFATTIHRSGSELLRLIDDILDLSKIEAGRVDVDPAPVDLAQVLGEVEQAFGPQAEDKGLELRVEVDADLPATITTDRQRLQQILRNLLANAVKFTGSGRVTSAHRGGRAGHRARRPRTRRGAHRDRLRRPRHRHRHPRRQARHDLRGVPAGGRDDEPQVRGHRPRSVDLQGAGPDAGRSDRGVVRARIRLGLHPAVARRAPDRHGRGRAHAASSERGGGAFRSGSARSGTARSLRRPDPARHRRRLDGRAAETGAGRLHRADRGRRRAQRVRPDQRAGAARSAGALRGQRRRGHPAADRAPRGGRRPDGRDDARPGRQRDDAPDPGAAPGEDVARRVPHREGHAR